MAQLYLKKRSDGKPKAVEGTDSGALYVNVDAQTPPTTLPLPTGAATSAKQDTGNASLASIDANLETNGIALLPLDADLDSIDVSKQSKGAVTTAHSAITATATSEEIDCRGYNSILVEADISVAVKNWTFKVQGCMVSGGTFVDWYDGTMTLMSYQTNASRGWVWHGIPDYIKIVATEDEDTATVTVKVQPFNS